MWVLFGVNAVVFVIVSIGTPDTGGSGVAVAAAAGWAMAAMYDWESKKKRGKEEQKIAELKDTLEGLVYWNEQGSIDQSWWDDAEKLISRDEDPEERG